MMQSKVQKSFDLLSQAKTVNKERSKVNRMQEVVRQFMKDHKIIWCDPHIDSETNLLYLEQLRLQCDIQTCRYTEEALIYIKKTPAFCFVIISGIDAEIFMKEIDSLPNVSKAYVIQYPQPMWIKNFSKACCAESKDSLMLEIKDSLKKWRMLDQSLNQDLQNFVAITQPGIRNALNRLNSLFQELMNFQDFAKAKEDFLKLACEIFPLIGDINDFQKAYDAYDMAKIIWWYTRETFVYKATNCCLKINTPDSIESSRLVARDLGNAIQEIYQDESQKFAGVVYRGGYFTDKEYEKLGLHVGREIEMSSFLSTSKLRGVAEKYVFLGSNPNKFVQIIVPNCKNAEIQGFAEVEKFSHFPQEKEILFNKGSRFTVLYVADKKSAQMSDIHVVLLYGAETWRSQINQDKPTYKVTIDEIEKMFCSCCNAKIKDPLDSSLFFVSLANLKTVVCKKCLPEFQTKDKTPLLCIPKIKDSKEYDVQGFMTTYPANIEKEIRFYGYQCVKCFEINGTMFYKCTNCTQAKKIWCQSCIDSAEPCLEQGHCVILEKSPFSFWCERMSQAEENDWKMRNMIASVNDLLEQERISQMAEETRKTLQRHEQIIIENQDNLRNPQVARSLIQTGGLYYNMGDYNKALENFAKALEVSTKIYKIGHPLFTNLYNNIGSVYDKLGRYHEAIDYYKMSLEQGRPNDMMKVTIELNIGEAYHKLKNFQSEKINLSSALKILQGDGDYFPYRDGMHFYNCTGRLYQTSGEYEKSLEAYFELIKICLKFYKKKTHSSIAMVCLKIGEVYDNKGDFQEAIKYYKKSVEVIEKLHKSRQHHSLATPFRNLGDVYQILGDVKSAVSYYMDAKEIEKITYGKKHPSVAKLEMAISSLSEVSKPKKVEIQLNDQDQQFLESLFES